MTFRIKFEDNPANFNSRILNQVLNQVKNKIHVFLSKLSPKFICILEISFKELFRIFSEKMSIILLYRTLKLRTTIKIKILIFFFFK